MGPKGMCSVTDLKQEALVNDDKLNEGFFTF